MNEPVVALSLQEAIARTVQHSLAIRVQSYDPAIKESLVHEAEANFDAVAFGKSQWSRTDEPGLAPSDSNGENWTNTIGIKQLLPTGTQIQASTSFALRDVAGTSPITSPPGKSYYTANLNVQLVQPLLRGFGADVNEATIYLAQRDLRISLSQFKQQVMASVGDVEEAYLNLVLARTNVEVLERLVVASEQTYNDVEAPQGDRRDQGVDQPGPLGAGIAPCGPARRAERVPHGVRHPQEPPERPGTGHQLQYPDQSQRPADRRAGELRNAGLHPDRPAATAGNAAGPPAA